MESPDFLLLELSRALNFPRYEPLSATSLSGLTPLSSVTFLIPETAGSRLARSVPVAADSQSRGRFLEFESPGTDAEYVGGRARRPDRSAQVPPRVVSLPKFEQGGLAQLLHFDFARCTSVRFGNASLITIDQ